MPSSHLELKIKPSAIVIIWIKVYNFMNNLNSLSMLPLQKYKLILKFIFKYYNEK